MRILITNDDGIYAPGLKILEAIARRLSDDITIVAPETDQSGVAHALTLNDPLRLREIAPDHYAVRGTPTDCVIMGVQHIMLQKPDLVLSGVNRGQNLAEDVLYSGTVAGAMEGAMLGIRSVAFSQVYNWVERKALHWECAEEHGASVLDYLQDILLPHGCIFNVNFPDCAPQNVKGIMPTYQGRRSPHFLKVEPRADGRQNPYFWIGFDEQNHHYDESSDLYAVEQNMISVSPLTINMGEKSLQAAMKKRIF